MPAKSSSRIPAAGKRSSQTLADMRARKEHHREILQWTETFDTELGLFGERLWWRHKRKDTRAQGSPRGAATARKGNHMSEGQQAEGQQRAGGQQRGAQSTQPPSSEQNEKQHRSAKNVPSDQTVPEREYSDYALNYDEGDAAFDGTIPDVLIDAPVVKLEGLDFELNDLRAKVALFAKVLDLVELTVGIDAYLGRVKLTIDSIEVQALLKVRLDNVRAILDRVLTTVDRNPQIVQELVRGVSSAVEDVGESAGHLVGEGANEAVSAIGSGAGSAVEDVGEGAGKAVEDVGEGAGSAVEDVGSGAGQAVESTGEAVENVGEGASSAVEDVGSGAGEAVGEVGQGVGQTAERVGQGAGEAVQEAGQGVGQTAQEVGQGAGQAAQEAGQGAGQAVEEAGQAAQGASDAAGQAAGQAQEAATGAAQQAQDAAGQATEQGGGQDQQGEQTGGNQEPKATHAAVQKAEELGINLSEIEGSGPDGSITIRDVRSAAQRG